MNYKAYLEYIIYKILSNRILWIILYILYIQFLFIILGSPVYCMDSDSYTNADEVKKDSEDIKDFNKEQLKTGVERTLYPLKVALNATIGGAALGAALDVASGDPDVGNKIAIAGIAGVARIGLDAIEHSMCESIDNMTEEISEDRPPSPSIYDLKRNSIFDIESIKEWLNSLEDKVRIIVCGVITLGGGILLYITRKIKLHISDKIYKKVNIENETLKKIIEKKKYMSNIFDKLNLLVICFFIILGIMMIIFAVWKFYL